MQWVGWAMMAPTVVVVFSILFFYWRTGAPPVAAGAAETADIVDLLQEAALSEGSRVYELGCGWGGLAVALARAFPTLEIIGVELSPIPWLVALLRSKGVSNLRIRRADFHAIDLRAANGVVCYLMMAPMKSLAQTLDRQLAPGAPVITLTFWFRNRRPVAVRRGPGIRGDVAMYRWEPTSPN